MSMSFDDVRAERARLEAAERTGLCRMADVVEEIRNRRCPSAEKVAAAAEDKVWTWAWFEVIVHVFLRGCPRCRVTFRDVHQAAGWGVWFRRCAAAAAAVVVFAMVSQREWANVPVSDGSTAAAHNVYLSG